MIAIPRDLGGLGVDGDGGRLRPSAGVHDRRNDRSAGSGGGRQPCATFEARSVNTLPPDVLILLDASGSMNNTTDDLSCGGGCGAASKWAQLTPALDALVAENESTVNWGLKMFADSDAACGVSSGDRGPGGEDEREPDRRRDQRAHERERRPS